MPLCPEQCPALELFLGAYLHQDWQDDYSSTEAAFEDYLASESTLALEIPHELNAVLSSGETDADILELIRKAGSYYLPDAHGLSARTWLTGLLELCPQAPDH